MDIKKALKELCGVDGVSGDELAASQTALAMLKEYTDDCEIDRFGNVIGHIGVKSQDRQTLLLDAHIDQIGFIVTYIDDCGFIRVAQCGGMDRHVLAAQTVTIHGRKKLKGVISVLPPHVRSNADNVAKIDDIVIDTGFSKDELSEFVEQGDRITVDSEFAELLNGRISAGAVDDRSGVVSILYALELLKDRKLKYNIDVSFTVQEETGERGAAIAAFNLKPDIVFEMDVSFASTPDSTSYKCGEMSKGVMIGFAPSLSRRLSKELKALAEDSSIPYQYEVMGGETGTNADAMSIACSGAEACTLSIPIRYMHTPVEVVDCDDIKAVSQLIAAFAEEKGGAVNGR